MSELELGQATIVYEDPEGGTTEETVENEQLVYVRDHWAVRSGTDGDDHDIMKQIPKERVYRVERNVERFEEEVQTVRGRVESIASELGEHLPVDVGEGRRRERGRGGETDPTRIPVSDADEDSADAE